MTCTLSEYILNSLSTAEQNRQTPKTSVTLPLGTYAWIAPRSGLAIRNFIDVGAGVVDSDYWGEINVVLFNHSTEDFVVQTGDWISQLIQERIETPQVKKVAALDDTNHGA